MTAATIPDERARRDPGGACVADERHELDNAGFAERVTALAAVFADAGLGPGGVLAIMLPNLQPFLMPDRAHHRHDDPG